LSDNSFDAWAHIHSLSVGLVPEGLSDSVDGTGIRPSVTPEAAALVHAYIKKLGFKGRVLDIGAGLCHLQASLESDPDFEAYSMEASTDVLKDVRANPDRVIVQDITKLVTEPCLTKAFDLSTSFELVEHIPREEQSRYWWNIQQISKAHLCAIHVTPPEERNHRCICKTDTWKWYFESKGFGVRMLKDFPLEGRSFEREEGHPVTWDGSAYFLLEF
jgi:hypothetical protein